MITAPIKVSLFSAGTALCDAAKNAIELLHLTGNAGSSGDTTDDLKRAVVAYEKAMQSFVVTIRTATEHIVRRSDATSSYNAFAEAAQRCGDLPFGITVKPATPTIATSAALESARRSLRITAPLEEALKDKSLEVILRRIALKHEKNSVSFDAKKRAANDLD